jgi:4-hydroxy-2-oxoheptanedioate aldolase
MARPFILSAWANLPGAYHHENMLRAGFDALTVDLQHGLCTLADVAEAVVRARLLDRPAFARVPIGDLAAAARCADFGVEGIVLPMIETVADAESFVRAVKYPPLGLRSYGPSRAAQMLGLENRAYFEAANERVLALAMIETAPAYAALDAILAVDGLDGVFVGPSDLSLALGAATPEPTAERTEEAVRAIAEAAKRANRIASIYAISVEDARRYRDYGYGIVCLSSDAGLLQQASAAACAAVRAP